MGSDTIDGPSIDRWPIDGVRRPVHQNIFLQVSNFPLAHVTLIRLFCFNFSGLFLDRDPILIPF